MATASGLNSARNKLDGLLKELIEKTDESADGDPIQALDSLSASMPPPSTPTKRSSSAKGPRKRRKKDMGYDGDGSDGSRSHSSYIMKLFDRSVDFSPFSEDTPLYTLAKEWIDNKPYRQRMNSDTQDFQDSDPLSASQGSSSSITNDSSSDSKFVFSLPHPNPLKFEKDVPYIPDTLPQPLPSLNSNSNVDTAPPTNELKRNHIKRWKKVKRSWREASIGNQARYSQSIKKIRDLFEH